ncbi:MAG: hypothetical protein MRY79_04745 [Alphaproteobacteria bacterium]|nr:hypothetical protein [Alphaproteobacteria bacterium]
MKYRHLFSIFALSFVLGACASIIDKQTQIVTLRTPGAVDAKCILENPDMRYHIYTDQTVEIMKSPHDLVVRCMAPGNREKTILVKRELNEWVFLNVSNGFVPGAAYDYFSRGGFDYPEEITVDFTGMRVGPYPLPNYHRDGVIDMGVQQKLERFGSGKVYSEANRYDPPQELQKIDRDYGRSDFDDPNMSETDGIHQQYNPHVSGGRSYDPTEEDK